MGYGLYDFDILISSSKNDMELKSTLQANWTYIFSWNIIFQTYLHNHEYKSLNFHTEQS